MDVKWNKQYDCLPTSFVGTVEKYIDKTETTLKEKSLFMYPIKGVLLYFSICHRRCIFEDGYKFIGFLTIVTDGTIN